jgi:hypothetical protein
MAKKSKAQNQIEIIRRQLTGTKQYRATSSTTPKASSSGYQIPTYAQKSSDTLVKDEISFLKKDLFKILVLSCLAFGFQFALFFALQKGLVTLPFLK